MPIIGIRRSATWNGIMIMGWAGDCALWATGAGCYPGGSSRLTDGGLSMAPMRREASSIMHLSPIRKVLPVLP